MGDVDGDGSSGLVAMVQEGSSTFLNSKSEIG